MDKEKILVVDDEEDILELLDLNLSREGYEIIRSETGEDALHKAKTMKPDLIILDLMLPGIDGLEACKLLKKDPTTKNISIIMLTAKGEEADIVVGLELGADDYVTKPFSPRVLLARVKVALRRQDKQELKADDTIKINDIVINPMRYEVILKGRPVELTVTEFKILHFLARHPGWVFTRGQIVDATKGADYPVTDRAVDVQIVNVRKKLGRYSSYVETVRGIGYRFKE